MADEEKIDTDLGEESTEDKPEVKPSDETEAKSPEKKPKAKAKAKDKAKPKQKGKTAAAARKNDPREALLKKLFVDSHKKYKGKLLEYATDVKIEGGVPRITTGVLPQDLAIGGGLPIGRISLYYGHKSTSKTANLLRAAGMAQRYCSNCWTPAYPLWVRDYSGMNPKCSCGDYRRAIVAWIDVEGAWEDDWYSRFIVPELIVKSQPSVGEQAIDICDTLLRSHAADIIIIDSIAFLAPSDELEKSAGDIQPGSQARLMGKAIRKFVSGINEIANQEGKRPTFWFINQIRMKIGVMFGNPETKPGGLAQGFAAGIEVRTRGGKYKMDDDTGKPISVEMGGVVKKNKTAPSNMEFTYKMVCMDTPIKRMGDVIDEPWAVQKGIDLGLIEKPTERTHIYGEHKFVGKSQVDKFFMENREEYWAYKERLLPLLLAM
jgi:recombination protein RecA